MIPKVKTAVVLAGGEGLRLRPLTNDRPKVMVEVNGRPLVDWVLRWLARNGIENVIMGVAYRKERIMDYVRDGKDYGLNIRYSEHTVEGGTAEGFRLAIKRYVSDEMFVAMNGDELTNVRLQDLASHHYANSAIATLTVSPLRLPFGVVRLQSDRIVSFEEKPMLDSLLVSTGVYAFRKEILDYLPISGEIERSSFPKLAAEGKLMAYRHTGFWMTVNTLKDLRDLTERIREMNT
jgi:NDP-sugar pyrophosphorylase family protein